ncbi:MAG TPA: hypothetical protein VLX68_04515 [Chitinivibrionales bacterium]|nr:hypothetical protein [Chitinivibrionales bacterium]
MPHHGVGLPPGSAFGLVAGPPEVAFGEGSAGNSLLLTLRST